MSIQYSSPAFLTGPCLESTCGQVPSSSLRVTTDHLNCSITLALCTTGSISYTNPILAQNPLGLNDPSTSTNCSYTLRSSSPDNSILGTCTLHELSGSVNGRGNVWSLFDDSSTIVVTATVLGRTDSVLYVDSTVPAAFRHFLTAVTLDGNGGVTQTQIETETLAGATTTDSAVPTFASSLPAAVSSTAGASTSSNTQTPALMSAASETSAATANTVLVATFAPTSSSSTGTTGASTMSDKVNPSTRTSTTADPSTAAKPSTGNASPSASATAKKATAACVCARTWVFVVSGLLMWAVLHV